MVSQAYGRGMNSIGITTDSPYAGVARTGGERGWPEEPSMVWIGSIMRHSWFIFVARGFFAKGSVTESASNFQMAREETARCSNLVRIEGYSQPLHRPKGSLRSPEAMCFPISFIGDLEGIGASALKIMGISGRNCPQVRQMKP